MASGSGKEVAGGKPGTPSSTARDRLALQADVGQPKDPEAFRKAQSGSPLANDPASLQEWFHNDPKAALERVIEARDPALVPALVDLLQDQAITHFHMAEALEQISDEPDRTRAIEIKRSEEAQVESLPPRAVTSAAEDDEIREHVERGELREAFLINRARASELIVEAKIDQTLRHSHANTLTRLLRHQARVQLFIALALARIAEEPQQKSRAIDILFAEAVQLGGDRETLCPILRSLESFEALTVIPGLIAYLRKADDGPLRDAALETFEHLIIHGFPADAGDAARRGRDLTLRFFGALLGGAALDEQERATVAGIVLRRAGDLGDGLDAVIGRMAELSNVTVGEMGWHVCGREFGSAAESAEHTAALGWLRRYLLCEQAGGAICAVASDATAAPASEGSVESPRAPIHPKLPDVRSPGQTSLVPHPDVSQEDSTPAPSPAVEVSSRLITMNGGGDGFSLVRSDAATIGVHTDQLDLASVSFSFTTADPAVHARTLLVSEPAEDLSRLDVFRHGEALLADIRKKQEPTAGAVQRYLDRLKEIDFRDLPIPQKRRIAETVNHLADESGLLLSGGDARDGGRLRKVTNVTCDVSNERSRGRFRLWSGPRSFTTDTAPGRFPALLAVRSRDGFSSEIPDATATGVHAHRLDLATVFFTTADPAVLRARTLLVSEPAEDLSRLDVFRHGEALLADIRKKQEPTAGAVQRYLDRLKEIDFRDLPIPQKRRIAETVSHLADESGLLLLGRDARDGGRLRKVTNVKCDVSNERSKGRFRLWSGSPFATDTTRGRFPALLAMRSKEAEDLLQR